MWHVTKLIGQFGKNLTTKNGSVWLMCSFPAVCLLIAGCAGHKARFNGLEMGMANLAQIGRASWRERVCHCV